MIKPGLSLSRPTSAWMTAGATIRKSLQIQRRYLPNLVGILLNLLIRMVFFFLLANVISVGGNAAGVVSLSGKNLFLFFQGALLLFVFNSPTLWGPINTVSTDITALVDAGRRCYQSGRSGGLSCCARGCIRWPRAIY